MISVVMALISSCVVGTVSVASWLKHLTVTPFKIFCKNNSQPKSALLRFFLLILFSPLLNVFMIAGKQNFRHRILFAFVFKNVGARIDRNADAVALFLERFVFT